MNESDVVLSHKDTIAFGELSRDERAAKLVFEAATTNYHNTLRQIKEGEDELWRHVHEAYNLDTSKLHSVRFDLASRRYVVSVEHKEPHS